MSALRQLGGAGEISDAGTVAHHGLQLLNQRATGVDLTDAVDIFLRIAVVAFHAVPAGKSRERLQIVWVGQQNLLPVLHGEIHVA